MRTITNWFLSALLMTAMAFVFLLTIAQLQKPTSSAEKAAISVIEGSPPQLAIESKNLLNVFECQNVDREMPFAARQDSAGIIDCALPASPIKSVEIERKTQTLSNENNLLTGMEDLASLAEFKKPLTVMRT